MLPRNGRNGAKNRRDSRRRSQFNDAIGIGLIAIDFQGVGTVAAHDRGQTSFTVYHHQANDITRIDQMRVFNLWIEVPNILPFPRIGEKHV